MSTSLVDQATDTVTTTVTTALDTIAAAAGVPSWAIPATAVAVTVAGAACYRVARAGRAARTATTTTTTTTDPTASDPTTMNSDSVVPAGRHAHEADQAGQAARAVRADRWLRRVETAGTIAAALLATAVSASGMWNFFEHILGVTGPARVLMFAFLEIALGVSAIRARRRIREVIDLMRAHAAGTWTGPIPSGRSVHQVLVWAVVALSGVMSAADTPQWSGKLLRLAAPAVAAVLWEIGDLAELQAARLRYGITPEPLAWRYSLRRLLVLARLADPTTAGAGPGAVDGVQVLAAADRSRRLTALVRARYRLEATPARAPHALRAWRAWRVRRLTIAAVERAGLGTTDPTAVHHVQHGLALLYTVQTGTSPTAVAHLDPWHTHNPTHTQAHTQAQAQAQGQGQGEVEAVPGALATRGVLAVPTTSDPADPADTVDADPSAPHRSEADPRSACVLAPVTGTDAPAAAPAVGPVAGPVPGPVVRGAAVAARPSAANALTATVPFTPGTDGQILARLAGTPAEALPSIRALMRVYGIGQNRATRIHRAATDRANTIPNTRTKPNDQNHGSNEKNERDENQKSYDENTESPEENTTSKISNEVTTEQDQLI